MNDVDVNARVEALVREGKHREAAAFCVELGHLERAAALYAAVWAFREAIDSACIGGLYDVAYRYALEAGNVATNELDALLEKTAAIPEQARRAAVHAEARGMRRHAGRLMEAVGDLDKASALYESACAFGDAARCYERLGRKREAGMLYERHLRVDPTDGDAALRLGSILASFGRHDDAVRAFQRASAAAVPDAECLFGMARSFEALGLKHAARIARDRVRTLHPSAVDDAVVAATSIVDQAQRSSRAERADEELIGARYRVVRTLGSGSSGRVVLAVDIFHDREVAIKVLTLSMGPSGRDAYARFEKEARIALKISHPNVVRVFEYDAAGPFLVLEYMARGTLDDRLRISPGSPLDPSEVRHIGLGMLAGLEVLHGAGIVHRDLKPANVFIGAAGEVKIGDLGIAHLLDFASTATGAMLGSLAYMAPEQITGGRPLAATDFYALGVMLHQLLTGTLPFPGPDYLTEHLQRPPPLVSRAAPWLGSGFDALLQTLLRKDPNDRPSSAAEVRSMIDALSWDLVLPEQSAAPSKGHEAESSGNSSVTYDDSGRTRYVHVSALDANRDLLRDQTLDRFVERWQCDASFLEHLRKLAEVSSPFLQCVYDIDLEERSAVLEHPAGTPLDECDLTSQVQERLHEEIGHAISAIHTHGLAHGSLERERVLVGEGRSVLLLPTEYRKASRKDDLIALSALRGS